MKHLLKVATDAEMVAKQYITVYYSDESGKCSLFKAVPPSNEIWYKTNDGITIDPQYMSPTTNEYTTKGVMTFSDNVTSIAQSAFKSKSTLTEFYGGMSLATVGSSAFYGCSSLTSIDLPNCTFVGGDAFNYCTSLTSVNLPSCTYVYRYAFANCTSLTSIDLPSCGTVANWAFLRCTSLTSIDLPNCTFVTSNAFTDCSRLTSVNLPSCAYVGEQAFSSCRSLTSIDLPNCTNVGAGAFACCSNLSKFTGLMTTEDNRCLMSYGTIYAFAPSGLTSYTREDCTTVGEGAFAHCSSLTSIDLPNCTSVGGDAFLRCTRLTSVNLPNCTGVGGYAFWYCTSLTSIDLPSCPSIGNQTFNECRSLTNVNLPNCTYIGNSAFYYCISLTSIDLPNCTYIGDSAFYSCSSLTSVTLGASTMCNLYNRYAFSHCSKLTSIYVPLSLVNTYKTDTNWSYFSNKIYPFYTPVTYKSLSITADDVLGRETNTIIHCTYLTDGVIPTGDELTDIEIIEDVVSESFDQNTSETETVERIITYSNHGLSASCTITQGVWFNNECNIDLNSQWVDSTKSVSGYKVLMSNSNKGVGNGYASMKVEFTGIPNFKLYINSYAESSYDYTIAWAMDMPAPTSLPSDTTTGAKANTRGKQYNPTSISNFTEVNYPNDGGTHYVWITYRKDNTGNNSDDRGYVAIPNEYFS